MLFTTLCTYKTHALQKSTTYNIKKLRLLTFTLKVSHSQPTFPRKGPFGWRSQILYSVFPQKGRIWWKSTSNCKVYPSKWLFRWKNIGVNRTDAPATKDHGCVLCVISQGLRELAGSVADHNWYFYRLMAVFLCERGLCLCDECIVELGLDEVDGTAAEAAAHDA